jgi:DNA-binding CsgD family transcriptional regulator
MDRRETNYEHLVEAIYDAGACPDQWPSVLSAIAAAAGAEGGVIFGFSRLRGLVFEYNGALDPHSATVFKARHVNNVWVQGMAVRPKNQLVISDMLIKPRELMRTEFYDEVLKSQKLVRGALATLTAGSDIEIQFSVEKSVKRGPFTAAEVTSVRRLIPHVRRALGVSVRLMSGASFRNRLCSIADCLTCPAITLTLGGEMVEANGHAQRLAESGFLPLSRTGLKLSDPSEERRLLLALKDVCGGTTLRSLVLTENMNRFEVVCMALHPQARHWNGPAPTQTAAFLLLVSPMRANTVEAAGLESLTSGLTVAERRVAAIAGSGISNAEIASVLGVSLNTVKTHLRRVYSKLDVKRQSELVLRLKGVFPETGQK